MSRTVTVLFSSFHPVYVQSNPPSPRPHRRGSTSRPVRRHTSRSESHASHGRYGRATPESSLDVTQSLGLTAAGLGHRRTSAAQEAQMKKTKSLDHQLSSEAKDYDSIEQVHYIFTPRACARGKVIGLSVCCCRRRRHENRQISSSTCRRLCVL